MADGLSRPRINHLRSTRTPRARPLRANGPSNPVHRFKRFRGAASAPVNRSLPPPTRDPSGQLGAEANSVVTDLQGRLPHKLLPHIESHSERPGALPRSTRAPRIALYSQGMVGFGHIRRNASIAQALRSSALQPTVLMIAEAWQAGALLVPHGVDFVTLPAVRRGANGGYRPRFLSEVSDRELITLRTRVIRDAIEVFEPDVLIVDYLPLGVAEELRPTLNDLHDRVGSRCVLGLRDVLYDLETVNRWWATSANLNAIKRFYDAIWIYGDPAVFDPVREYDFTGPMVAKTHHT